MWINKKCLSLLALFSFCLPLQALDITVLPWDSAVAERKLSISAGGKAKPIEEMNPRRRSRPIRVSANAENLRLEAIDRRGEDGEVLFEPLKIPSSFKNPLLLLMPSKDKPTGIEVHVIEDDVNDFDWGSRMFINITGKDLVFRSENRNLLIPKGIKPTNYQPKGAPRNIDAALYLRENLKAGPLYSSIWNYRKDLRQMVFIIPSTDKSRGLIKFKFIVESQNSFAARQKKQTQSSDQ